MRPALLLPAVLLLAGCSAAAPTAVRGQLTPTPLTLTTSSPACLPTAGNYYLTAGALQVEIDGDPTAMLCFPLHAALAAWTPGPTETLAQQDTVVITQPGEYWLRVPEGWCGRVAAYRETVPEGATVPGYVEQFIDSVPGLSGGVTSYVGDCAGTTPLPT
jgi:hypothetical protein